MEQLEWKRTEYKTWDEAFRGLIPAIRQQSTRTAAYTRALYVRACSLHFGGDDPNALARIRGQLAGVAYKCGMYCQIGKALVPPEYQLPQKDFTAEELAVYRKYTTDGSQLVIRLQAQEMSSRERKKLKIKGYAEDKVPRLMIREAAQQHMERWDGSGWPEGRTGEAISAIAQIVGLALELDRLSAGVKSEQPFDEALETLRRGSGTLWNPALIEVLNKAEGECREIYQRHIHYTMTLPETVPLLVKRPERPFGLLWQPMLSDAEGTVAAYEGVPWFHTAPDGDMRASLAEMEEQLSRIGLVNDVSFYLLYEATDLLYRLKNCELPVAGVILPLLPGFFRDGSKLQELQQLFADQPVDREKLILSIPEDFAVNANKGVSELVARYGRNGVRFLIDGWHPDRLSAERLTELGIRFLRPAPELIGTEAAAAAMRELRRQDFRFIGGGADTEELLRWLLNEGVLFAGGTITGIPETEDELIRTALLKERV